MRVDEAALRERVAATLFPSLRLAAGDFTMARPDPSGTSSSIFLIHADNLPPLLLRAFKRRVQAVRNVQALRHLEQQGVRAPRLVFHDLSRGSRLLRSPDGALPFLTVETWVEGTRVTDLTDRRTLHAARLKVAALLARFHAVTRDRWGRPGRPRRVPYVAHTLRKVRAQLRRVAARDWLRPADIERIRDAFDSWRARIAQFSTFNLVHKDANPDNFILDTEGAIVPVDLHRVAYAPFPEELVTALHHVCPEDPEGERVVLEAYFARGNDEAKEIFEAIRGFFEPLYFLKKLHRRAERTGPERLPGHRRMYCGELAAIRRWEGSAASG
ncbi:MAG: phosphotransferase [Acidobacteriota bacterium]